MTLLSTSKPAANTEVDATALSSNFTAIENVVNGNIDEANVATGLVYSPSKIKQGGAVTGDTLVWDGVAWVPGQGGTPTGAIIDFGGSAAPTGWLLCDGTEVSRTTYADLDAVIGTTYGAYTNGSGGVGTTHLLLPNFKGKVPVHRNSSDTAFDTLGETGGAATHALSVAELAVHSHLATDAGHQHGLSIFRDPGPDGFATMSDTNPTGTTQNTNTGFASITVGNAGSGTAHNNLQPYLVVNRIIKT